MSRSQGIAGWDLGGAHLKVALLDEQGRLQRVVQLPTPLWQGLDRLDAAIDALTDQAALDGFRHALTMTGELVDLFESRAQGVAALSQRVGDRLGAQQLRLFAGPHGFVPGRDADRYHAAIASANWYATAVWLAREVPAGLLLDVGSTTSDILPLRDGRVINRGYSDRERLACGELVYSGVVRTPLMAVADELPFDGEWVALANEHFATLADVYRVLGWLPDDADLHPTVDGRGKDRPASMCRLARMLGADLEDATAAAWHALAACVADRQLDALARACHRQFSRGLPADAPLIGAGSGRFLVARLAARLDRRYLDIDDCLPRPALGPTSAGDCAPATAVALLAREEDLACAC